MVDFVERSHAGAAPTFSASLFVRRVLFTGIVAATMAGLLWLLAVALSVGGLDAVDIMLLVLFAVTLPWTVIGFWNATIGFLIMRFARDPIATVTPAVARVTGNEPITASTAILVCIRNEAPARVIRNLEPMLEGLVASGAGAKISPLRPERHRRGRDRGRRGGALRCACCRLGRAPADHLSAAHRQPRLQGRQRARLLRTLGRPA